MRRTDVLQTVLLLPTILLGACELIGHDAISDGEGLVIQTAAETYAPGADVALTIENRSGQTIYLMMCSSVDGLPTYELEKREAGGWRFAAGLGCPRVLIERRLAVGAAYACTTTLEGFVQRLDTIPGTYRYQFHASYRSYFEGQEELDPDLTVSNTFEVVE